MMMPQSSRRSLANLGCRPHSTSKSTGSPRCTRSVSSETRTASCSSRCATVGSIAIELAFRIDHQFFEPADCAEISHARSGLCEAEGLGDFLITQLLVVPHDDDFAVLIG